MHLPDTNVWLALTVSTHAHHKVAAAWFASQSAKNSILLCRATQQSLLRLLTTKGVMELYGLPAMTNAEAWKLHDGWLGDWRVGWTAEPSGLEAHWKKFSARNTASPKLWMDAYLAAFATACGATLVTTDHAFSQFAGLSPNILTKPAKA